MAQKDGWEEALGIRDKGQGKTGSPDAPPECQEARDDRLKEIPNSG